MANDKYPVRHSDSSSSPIQMQSSLKPKTLSDFFDPFLESTSNFEHFETKMIIIATLFWKLQTVKDLFRPLSKKHRLRIPFDSQDVKGSQTLVTSSWEHFHHIFPSLWENVIWKISPLLISYIFGVFRNTLTANDKYPVHDCENLLSPIQIQSSLKPKRFSDSFVPFL